MAELALDDVQAMLDAAGEVALHWFRTTLEVGDKGDAGRYDPVTEADRGVETLLRDQLRGRFGDHEIVGEEFGTTGTPGRYRWMIDPIDGTRAFVTGSPLWGILLGLIDDGEPVAGWLHQPYLGETFLAVDSEAVLLRGGERTPLRTRRGRPLSEAAMYTTTPAMFGPGEQRAAFERLGAAVQLPRFGGDCYAYALLAMGQVDLVVEASLQPYDIVPLIPIIEAAGGIVTTRTGEPATGGGFVVAAATPELHAEALALLNA